MTSQASGEPAQRESRVRRLVGLLGAAGVGFILAVQSRINGALGARLDDALAAALISFSTGLIILLVGAAAVPQARQGTRQLFHALRAGGQLRVWQCSGGLCGAYLVFSQAIAVRLLGVALFTVAVVAGQVTSGMAVDRIGLGPAGPQRITTKRVVGAVLAVVAVVIAVSAELSGARASWLVLLPALAGVGTAWQQAVNGRVKQTADSAITASTLNFATGTAALAAVFAIEVAVVGLPSGLPSEPWLYIGGAMGIFVIGGSAVLVHYVGVLLLSMGVVAGQLVGALVLDLVVPAPGARVEVSTLIGIGLTLIAVGIAALPTRLGTSRRFSVWGLPR